MLEKFAPFVHAGQLRIIMTKLDGLKSSVASFHSRLSDALTALAFVPSIAGYDIWILNEGDYYFYMAYYCDDLIVVNKDPDNVFDSITPRPTCPLVDPMDADYQNTMQA